MVKYEFTATEERLLEDLRPVVEGLGFHIVDLRGKQVKTTFHVSVIIHSPDGVGLDGCETVHRTVLPRLEMMEDNRDIHVEVSSPGIDRAFRTASEFAIFVGKGVRVLLKEENDWIGGIISSAGDKEVCLETDGDTACFGYAQIRKARLDDSQEVR